MKHISALLIAFLLLPTARTLAQTLPTGFTLTHVVAPPFGSPPIGFAFLPDGRIILIEQGGGVRIAPVGSPTSTALLTIPNVVSGDERGLLGVAVDPGWPVRPYLYFYYTRTGNVAYLTMYTVSGDLTNPASALVTLGSPYFLITDLADGVSFHNGGSLRFGTDGMLLLSVGDDGGSCGAQNVDVPVGKIFRLNVASMPGAGTGPPPKADLVAPGHPFDSGEIPRLIGVLGFRNPFRFTVDALTGSLVIGDVGLDTMEEIDLLPAAGLGSNFGWPQLEGTINPMCCGSCGIGNVFTAPIATYPHDGGPKSVVAGPILRRPVGASRPFPVEYEGDIFFTDYYDGWIRRIEDTGGTWSIAPSVPGQPSASNWAQGFAFISDMQLGPDASVYICKMFGAGTAGISRISPDPGLGIPFTDVSVRSALRVDPLPARAGEFVRLSWSSPRNARATVTIRDVAGRVVSVLSNGVSGAEGGEVVWNGCTSDGRAASTGTYFARLEFEGGGSMTGKITLLR